MYCQSCGAEAAQGLKYCNRCGANLNSQSELMVQMVRPVGLTGPALVLGLTMVSSLIVIFMGITKLARTGVNPLSLTWIAIFSLAATFGIAALLIKLWSRLLSLPPSTNQLARPNPPTIAHEHRPPAQILARREPISSVTEHTTRTFEPLYKEPRM